MSLIRQQAVQWVLCLQGNCSHADPSHSTLENRNADVLEWVRRSDDHLRQLWRILDRIDRLRIVDPSKVDHLLSGHTVDI